MEQLRRLNDELKRRGYSRACGIEGCAGRMELGGVYEQPPAGDTVERPRPLVIVWFCHGSHMYSEALALSGARTYSTVLHWFERMCEYGEIARPRLRA